MAERKCVWKLERWYKTHRKYHNVSPPSAPLHLIHLPCIPHSHVCRQMHRPVIDVYELMSIFFCGFTVSGWWMHSISLVIHLIYSLPQRPVQSSVSYSPIGVIIAHLVHRGHTGDQAGRGRCPFQTTGGTVWCNAALLCYEGEEIFLCVFMCI